MTNIFSKYMEDAQKSAEIIVCYRVVAPRGILNNNVQSSQNQNSEYFPQQGDHVAMHNNKAQNRILYKSL